MDNQMNSVDQLQGLIATLDYQEKVKRDYVASPSSLIFHDGQLQVVGSGETVTYRPTDHFHSQMAEKLNIPGGYYKKMLAQASSLLDTNVNHWLNTESKNFLVRTFQDAAKGYQARAFLSDSYSIIDNYQILMEALESIKEAGVNVKVVNAELSETRMYLKVVAPEIVIQATEMLRNYRLSMDAGTGVISGFVLQNSEVGNGAFQIMPRAVVLACTNGAVMTQDALRKIHLGSRMDELGFNKNKNVMAANVRLIKEQMKHAVKVFLSKEYLKKVVDTYSDLGQPKIEAPVQNVIEVVGKKYQIGEERRANILKYFIEGGDTRRMGLASAMTRECQDLTNADTKHETEVASFEILKDFKPIEAAAMKMKNSAN
jgi:hypothetical protein